MYIKSYHNFNWLDTTVKPVLFVKPKIQEELTNQKEHIFPTIIICKINSLVHLYFLG